VLVRWKMTSALMKVKLPYRLGTVSVDAVHVSYLLAKSRRTYLL